MAVYCCVHVVWVGEAGALPKRTIHKKYILLHKRFDFFVTFCYTVGNMGDTTDAADKIIGLSLDPQTVEELDRIAAETFRTRAGLIRLAINRLIAAEKTEAAEVGQ